MEAKVEKCEVPYSVKILTESLEELNGIAKRGDEISTELLVQFRTKATNFFKKYGVDCSCNECESMLNKLITIIMTKINVKVLDFYGIGISSVSFEINPETPTLTVVVEKHHERPADS